MDRIRLLLRGIDVSDLAILAGLGLLWQTYGPGLAGALLLGLGLLPMLAALRRKP